MEKRRDDKFLEAFGKRVRELRTERGQSQSELAALLNTDRAYIGKIESGQKEPRISILPNLCKALGIELKDVLDFNWEN